MAAGVIDIPTKETHTNLKKKNNRKTILMIAHGQEKASQRGNTLCNTCTIWREMQRRSWVISSPPPPPPPKKLRALGHRLGPVKVHYLTEGRALMT